jgi:hypothetical protein
MPELEISWMSEEREEQEEEECGKKLELDLEPPSPEPNEEQECQLPRQQGLTCSCCLSRNHDTAYPFCVWCGYKFYARWCVQYFYVLVFQSKNKLFCFINLRKTGVSTFNSLLQVERKLLYDIAVCVCCILYVKSCLKILTVY